MIDLEKLPESVWQFGQPLRGPCDQEKLSRERAAAPGEVALGDGSGDLLGGGSDPGTSSGAANDDDDDANGAPAIGWKDVAGIPEIKHAVMEVVDMIHQSRETAPGAAVERLVRELHEVERATRVPLLCAAPLTLLQTG